MLQIAVHRLPAWGPKANVLIRAELSADGRPGEVEQLWARRIDGRTFQLCCIPFFAMGLALGDRVEVDDERTICRLLQKSGHRTVRITIADRTRSEALQSMLRTWVAGAGFLHEWCGSAALAIDIPTASPDEPILSALDPWSADGALLIDRAARPAQVTVA